MTASVCQSGREGFVGVGAQYASITQRGPRSAATPTHDGLVAARARGRIGGRPTVMTASKPRIARQMLDAGNSALTEIAATIGVGRATLYRHLDLTPRARG